MVHNDSFDLYKQEVMRVLNINIIDGIGSSLVYVCFKNKFSVVETSEELKIWISTIEEDYNLHGYYD